MERFVPLLQNIRTIPACLAVELSCRRQDVYKRQMEDNAAARDFLSRLPLEITLNDYNNMTEKIFYPDPALTTEGRCV